MNMGNGQRVTAGNGQRATGNVVRLFAALILFVGTASAQESLLADAAQRGDLASVKAMISRKADVNIPQGDGMTALHWAAERGDIAMTTALLGAKADVKLTTRIGNYTPLLVASKT